MRVGIELFFLSCISIELHLGMVQPVRTYSQYSWWHVRTLGVRFFATSVGLLPIYYCTSSSCRLP